MRVFVSSVIDGFKEFRLAVRHAITLLGFDPVMAEDFPAQPRSPGIACLEQVRSSDIYVGVLGPRYGSLTDSGRSATEEEFDEASRLSLPRLIFATTADMDEAQGAFIARVRGGWGKGLYYAQFGTPEELKDQVVKALGAMLRQRRKLPERQAAEHLEQLLVDAERDNGDVVLSLALVPESQGEALMALDDIDPLASDLPGLLAGILRGMTDYEIWAKETSVELAHPSTREAPFVMFEAFDDGRMICRLEMRAAEGNPLAASHMIDINNLEADLSAIIEVFSLLLRRIDQHGSAARVYVHGRPKGVKWRVLDVTPEQPLRSFTIPSHELADPLPFPTRPHLVSMQELANAGKLARTLRSTLKRLFKEGSRGRY